MKSIIEQKQPGNFIALEADTQDRAKLQCLSTEVMQWSKDIWILDLTAFKTYWDKESQTKNLSLMALWRKVLNRVFGTTPNQSGKIISFTASYRAVSGSNPWIAILLLYQMRNRDTWGLVAEKSRSGLSLLNDMSWESWWQAIEQAEEHYSNLKFKRFKHPLFRRQKHRLQSAIQRLVFKYPRDMGVLNYTGIKNRYGTILASLWRMTYGPISKTYQTDFPWESWRFHFNPAVNSAMDYPLFDWLQMAPILISDLDRLAKKLEHSGERITQIDWQIRLVDMTEMVIPITFRNPHNLYLEKGDHTTTLLQAQYGFRERMQLLLAKQQTETFDFGKQAITSWQLKVTKSMVLQPVIMDIFGEITQKDSDLETLSQLENELPVTLNQYEYACDWMPEDSFISSDGRSDLEPEGPASEMESLFSRAAEHRPLYIFNQPQPLDKPVVSQTAFTESSLDKWWLKGDVGGFERNYYRCIAPDGKAIWAFCDSHGKWYQHGVFG
jgi:hypothetical protein